MWMTGYETCGWTPTAKKGIAKVLFALRETGFLIRNMTYGKQSKIHISLNIALLLKEIPPPPNKKKQQNSKRSCTDIFSEMFAEIRPEMFNALLAGGKVSPKISPDFHIRYFKFHIRNFTQKIGNTPLQVWQPQYICEHHACGIEPK